MRRAPEDKLRDAERTKGRILQAALEEFAAKGFAGARVSEIAAKAGVNKQLISYYFGGKEGLYDEFAKRWQNEESAFADPSMSLAQLAAGYVRANSANRDLGRLMVRQALNDDRDDPAFAEDMRRELALMRERQAAGEFPADLDPATLLLAVFAIASAGVSFPQLVRTLYDLDPASPEFGEHYAGQVERLVGYLRG